MRFFRLLAFVLFLFVFSNTVYAQQIPPQVQEQLDLLKEIGKDEHIQNYDVSIKVNTDGSLEVTENIKVFAKGVEIKRGIYRDLPTISSSKYGEEIKPIKILAITKNGQPEPFFTESINQGIRIYIGDSNTFLQVPNYYNYQIKYLAQNQIRYFTDHDEVYWNVTGNFWIFPITSATAKVILPFDLKGKNIQTVSYIGNVGSSTKGQQALVTQQNNATTIDFAHNQTLGPQQGLTVAVKFPKGYITEPQTSNIGMYATLVKLFAATLITALGILILLYWWHKHGREQGGLPSIPVNFGPPENASPLEVRFIDKMGKNDYVYMTLAVLQLALNGYIKIVETSKKTYSAVRTTKTQTNLSDLDSTLLSLMFPKEISQDYNPETTINELTKKKTFAEKLSDAFSLTEEPEGVFSFNKTNLSTLTSMHTAVTKPLSSYKKRFLISNYKMVGYMFLLNLVAWVLYLCFLVYLYAISIGTDFSYFGSFLAPSHFFSFLAYAVLAVLGISSLVIAMFMPRRTKVAREMQDKIEGFKIFLKSQEYYLKGIENNIPEQFNMYEKYLPFAIALDLEPIWSAKFKDVINKIAIYKDQEAGNWFVTSTNNFNLNHFSASSFSTGIASSMRSTSSHSGSSGFSGGSSGGGGGGGGGGGW
jgi:uncharacterized membrane protein YgcG